MKLNAPPTIMQPATWIAQFLFWLIIVGLLGFAVSGCSQLGIATEDYVAERIEAQNDRTAEAAGEVALTFEPLAPGFSAYVEQTLKGKEIRPPPQPDPSFPWLEVLGIVGAAFGVSVPAAVKATNLIRDAKRHSYGEATSVKEAVALGQIPSTKVTA